MLHVDIDKLSLNLLIINNHKINDSTLFTLCFLHSAPVPTSASGRQLLLLWTKLHHLLAPLETPWPLTSLMDFRDKK